MIQYRLQILAGGHDCTVVGNQLVIGLDDGLPSFMQAAGYVNIGTIEVYVSGNDSQFQIVGIERSREDTDVRNVAEVSVPTSDAGKFLGWSRGQSGQDRTLVLDFAAPHHNGSEHKWVFGDGYTPPLKLTVKVKRQESPNSQSCASWPAILPPTPPV
jgi:hypothetical protein